MTDGEKSAYKNELMAMCKVYCHIDYNDDEEIVKLMRDTVLAEMSDLIPNFDQYDMTARQKLLALISVKELYDNREKYQKDTTALTNAVSSMLLKEIYGGGSK